MAITNPPIGNLAAGGLAPLAPTIGTATAGDTQATVAFTAPSWVGKGTGTVTYTATSSPGGFTGTATSSPITVTGLTNGTAYTFTVTATTSYGVTGASSAASNSITPAAQGSYESIATITVSSDTPSITFNSIPNTYKHLQIIGMAKNSEFYTASASCSATFNGDTGSNYNGHYGYTNGTITIGGSASSWSNMYIMEGVPRNYAGAAYSGLIWDILDYADTNKWKTSYAQSGYPNTYMMYASNLWRSTSAVSSITITAYGGFNHVAGSFFALYGIKG